MTAKRKESNGIKPPAKGIFAVYKPEGVSSFFVVRYLKKIYPGEKIGHGGTLDRMAEGVLVIGIGRESTRKLNQILKKSRKVYRAVIELGKTSTTDDREGSITKKVVRKKPTVSDVNKVLSLFLGKIKQKPPKYSAVKIKGERAYRLARAGISFTIKPREVTIYKIRLLKYHYPDIHLEVTVSSGTYIRSLARDIGRVLHTGAYLKTLLRTKVDGFSVQKALRIDSFLNRL